MSALLKKKHENKNGFLNLVPVLIWCFLLCIVLFASCKQPYEIDRSELVNNNTSSLIENFTQDLNALSQDHLSSIDKATEIFQNYAAKTNNLTQRDSLFFPYFSVYNIGRKLLQKESENVIKQYGFSKINKNGKSRVVPSQSQYLESNVLKYLSPPMQKFCKQQLMEFSDSHDIQTIGKNTIWWEAFNREQPDFSHKDMAFYHYQNWHLKNLISGTKDVLVFDDNNRLTENAENIYKEILRNHANTETAKTIISYLNVLKKNEMKRTIEVIKFLEQFN